MTFGECTWKHTNTPTHTSHKRARTRTLARTLALTHTPNSPRSYLDSHYDIIGMQVGRDAKAALDQAKAEAEEAAKATREARRNAMLAAQVGADLRFKI